MSCRKPAWICLVRWLLACTCAVAAAAAQGQPSAVAKAIHTAPATPAAPAGAAAPVEGAAGSSLALQIQRINERMALLQAQLNELELQARISAKRKEIDSAGRSVRTDSAFDSRAGLPSVQSVAGLQGRLEAVLVFASGVTQRVKAGDVLDDRRVANVSLNEVVLTDLHGRNVQRLAFGVARPDGAVFLDGEYQRGFGRGFVGRVEQQFQQGFAFHLALHRRGDDGVGEGIVFQRHDLFDGIDAFDHRIDAAVVRFAQGGFLFRGGDRFPHSFAEGTHFYISC